MTRLFACGLAAIALLAGCTLEYQRCGEDDVGCPGDDSVCVCSTGRCAEPDPYCASGLHYLGSRCVSRDEALRVVPSTPDEPGLCSSAEGGADADADASDSGDVRDSETETGMDGALGDTRAE
jgi:hypothetical protein